jgi:hypothetical protein
MQRWWLLLLVLLLRCLRDLRAMHCLNWLTDALP